jgi:hypothetical protein
VRKPHDRGGLPAGPIDRKPHGLAPWEKRVNALSGVLSAKGLRRVDEGRRAMENMDPQLYESIGYYSRWVVGMETLLVERGVLTREEVDDAMGSDGA